MIPKFFALSALLAASVYVRGADVAESPQSQPNSSIVISVPEQRLALLKNGAQIAVYPISTSRYGLGDRFNSYATPVGLLEVAQKIGDGARIGTVYKNRRPTGEVIRPNAAGRDPIVTRILWLRGLQASDRNAFSRNIYIHGTPVERLIGKPVSYGCIRMRSQDVVDLYRQVDVGTKVNITTTPMRRAVPSLATASL